ncbi:MAG TPA: hypothetical protein VMT29_06240 [Steroidobacteraceae bacterium]|nr:hypothetical protein [Steroidobacteraceae bacterium]
MLPLTAEPPESGYDPGRILRRAHWFFITRIRGSFEDVVYATLLVTALLVYNVLLPFVTDQVNVPLAARLHWLAHGTFLWTCLMLPGLLMLSMALGLAPRQGARRWVWLIVVAVLGTFGGNRIAVLFFDAKPTFDHISQGFVTFLLVCAGCFLHNTLRHTKGALFRAELDSTALQANSTARNSNSCVRRSNHTSCSIRWPRFEHSPVQDTLNAGAP